MKYGRPILYKPMCLIKSKRHRWIKKKTFIGDPKKYSLHECKYCKSYRFTGTCRIHSDVTYQPCLEIYYEFHR